MNTENFGIGVNKVKLKHLGFTEAGKSSGNIETFKNFLELIFNGRLLDESIKLGLTEQETQNINTQINKEKNEINSFKNEIAELDNKINQYKAQVQELGQERIDIISGKKPLPFEGGRFNLMKFVINSFFLLMLSIYLFLFYVGTVYKALYIDVTQVADHLTNFGELPSALPGQIEMFQALSNNIVVIFAPFVFYAFGYALHIFLEQKSKKKYIWIALIILITFILDFLIARKIHDVNNEALSLIGQNTVTWQDSKTFLIIIFMGFVVYIIWSILFHSWLTEWNKRDITGRIDDAILELKKQINKFKDEISAIRRLITEKEGIISDLERKMTSVQIPKSDLRFCISEFSAGWLQFLSGIDTFSELRKNCQEILENFQKDKFI